MKKIKLTRGLETIVDDGVFEFLNTMKWYAIMLSGRPYAFRTYSILGGGKGSILMHSALMGIPRLGMSIDHINRNSLDNRLENLREVSHSRNVSNRIFPNANGFPGVHAERDGKWSSKLTVEKKLIRLGGYGTKEEAAQAYREAYLAAFNEEPPFYR